MASNLQNVSSAHSRREQFIKLHGLSRMHEIRILYQMWASKDWTNLGWESWKAYLENPIESGGLDLSKSWAMELIAVYQRYIKELKQPESILSEVPARKLYVLKGKVTEKNVEELVNAARTTPLQDLVLERDGVDSEDHRHQWENYRRCKVGKEWEKIEK
jgi:hypothetical protein